MKSVKNGRKKPAEVWGKCPNLTRICVGLLLERKKSGWDTNGRRGQGVTQMVGGGRGLRLTDVRSPSDLPQASGRHWAEYGRDLARNRGLLQNMCRG